MKDLMEMLSKKKKSKKSDKDKDAKMEVLQNLHKLASEMMGGDMLGEMKKVTVAAQDQEGLQEGLDKAKSLLGGMPQEMPEMEKEEDEEDEDEYC